MKELVEKKLNEIKLNEKGKYAILWTKTAEFPCEPVDENYNKIVDYDNLKDKIYKIIGKDENVKELKIVELPEFFEEYSILDKTLLIDREMLTVDDIVNLYTLID